MNGRYSRRNLLWLICSLSRTSDAFEWGQVFRDAMSRLLPGVDRISVNINRASDLARNERGVTRASLIRVNTGRADGDVEIVSDATGTVGAERAIRAFARAGLPVHEYHTPACFEYFRGPDFLGTMILWRLRSEPPLDEAIIAFVEQMEPFFRFAFTDSIARFQSDHYQFLQSRMALDKALNAAHSTPREREVALCRTQGMSIEEISKCLHLSVPTVRRHLSNLVGRVPHQLSPYAPVGLTGKSRGKSGS